MAREMDLRSADELYVALGCGDLHLGKVINKLAEVDREKVDELLVTKPITETNPPQMP